MSDILPNNKTDNKRQPVRTIKKKNIVIKPFGKMNKFELKRGNNKNGGYTKVSNNPGVDARKVLSPEPRRFKSNFGLNKTQQKKNLTSGFRSPNIFNNRPRGQEDLIQAQNKTIGLYKEDLYSNGIDTTTLSGNKRTNNTFWLQTDQRKAFQTLWPSDHDVGNPNNFHKLGTVLDHNMRKISIVGTQNNRRNTNVEGFNTQTVVNNLWAANIQNVRRKNQRENAMSPQPQLASKYRAFSPCNISEFEEEGSDQEYYDSSKNIVRDDIILSQFHGYGKAVTPNLKPSDRIINNRSAMKMNYINRQTPIVANKSNMKNEDMRKTPLLKSNYPGSHNNSRNNSRMNKFTSDADSDFHNNSKESLNMYATYEGSNSKGISRVNNNQMITITSPSAMAGGLNTRNFIEMGEQMSCALRSPEVVNLKSNQLRPKFPKNQKLKPLKTQSAIIDPDKNRKALKAKSKKNCNYETNNITIQKEEELVNEEPMTSLFANHNINRYGGSSMNSSKLSKSKPRYSNSEFETKSKDDSSSENDEDNVEVTLYEQLNQSIKNFEVDENGRLRWNNEKDRKVSITGIISPLRPMKKENSKNSEEAQMYQESTVYSNNMNKSSKNKSGFNMSSDFFSFGDDEVPHERNNKNKEILNLLSESDFEQIKKAIEHDYQKNSKDLFKVSQKRPFSSCVEDPKAEDADSL